MRIVPIRDRYRPLNYLNQFRKQYLRNVVESPRLQLMTPFSCDHIRGSLSVILYLECVKITPKPPLISTRLYSGVYYYPNMCLKVFYSCFFKIIIIFYGTVPLNFIKFILQFDLNSQSNKNRR